MHEDFARVHDITPGSDRTFGAVMAGGLLLIALAPLRDGRPARWWVIAVGGAFSVFALVRPGVLQPLNVAWTRLGLLLNRVTGPILLGLIFYVVIVPTGLVMRMAGRDVLRRKRDRAAASYWQPSAPAVPPSSMKQQF